MQITKSYHNRPINYSLLADIPNLFKTSELEDRFKDDETLEVIFYSDFYVSTHTEKVQTHKAKEFTNFISAISAEDVIGFRFIYNVIPKSKYSSRFIDPCLFSLKTKNDIIILELNYLDYQDSKTLSHEIETRLQLHHIDQLSLTKKVSDKLAKERTVFIAHSFDDLGKSYAYEIVRFFDLIGFNVATGESFSPEKVSSKVMKRIKGQELVVAIISSRVEFAWLQQEAATAHALMKPLFLLIEEGVDFKPGLLADLEYIKFPKGNIGGSLLGILEGIRELGYTIK